MRCPYCDGPLDTARVVEAAERQFGLGGSYHYATCAGCAALVLLDPPAELDRFYPSDYYSIRETNGGAVARARRAATRFALTGRGAAGRLIAALEPPAEAAYGDWLREIAPRRDARILDVGCGGGALLRSLAGAGYSALRGIDPYLPADVREPSLTITRGTLDTLDGAFDVVMLHHVLEHVRDPGETLRGVRRRLAAGGWAIVRVPIVPNDAFVRHGGCWVQLDAPRHLTIPSVSGLTALAERHGLERTALRYDSTPIQFWGSALYERGETLQQGGSRLGWLAKQRGRRAARRANAEGRGDQAAFLFRAR
jgi:SAM-dependent methyltransferase